MNERNLCLKSVYELRLNSAGDPLRYRISAYQRGYRWKGMQVTQLLDDIREFSRRANPQPTDFYCLQPLVLKPDADGGYEVVDGQQRLTTLLLISRFFDSRLMPEHREPSYTLRYDTRPNLIEFLDDSSGRQAADNIDFFHIDHAAKTIKTWFKDKGNEVDAIRLAFLNQAKVIWYELPARDKPVDAFTRLNVGKIKLTSGELVRALFLRRVSGTKPGSQRLQIAYEWDLLEKSLQRPDFWCFLSNETGRNGNRIDYLLNLVARTGGMKEGNSEYPTFGHFSVRLNVEKADPAAEWLVIKQTFMLLEEWYENRDLYHLVGFLIWEGLGLDDLMSLAGGCTKAEFKEKLRTRILSLIFPDAGDLGEIGSDALRERIGERLDQLKYGNDEIRSVLLLFNLTTLILNRKSNARFQFENFKIEDWDIEHVRSVADDAPGTRKGQVDWLQHCLGYLESVEENESDLQREIKRCIDQPTVKATDESFGPLYEKLLRYFNEEGRAEEPHHDIGNLVLLDAATNRSYKNAVFAVKRHRILTLDRHGVFVPTCTRNVFLKCYNPRVDHVIFWDENDRNSYRREIGDTLYAFFTGGWINE